ncbi:MAG: GNAT family N-acetyltransferase [Limisphaerales bacterium]
MNVPVVQTAHSPDHWLAVRELFLEYARSLDFSLCFQGFDEELATLPGAYAPPRGGLWLAEAHGRPAGCVALRPLDLPGTAEVKRLYVRPSARGCGLGRTLAETAILAARTTRHARLVLDTVPAMAAAIALYRSLGFTPVPPYTAQPPCGALAFELWLS